MGAEGDEARALLRSIQSAAPLPQHHTQHHPRGGGGAGAGRRTSGLAGDNRDRDDTPGSSVASGTRRSRLNLSSVSGFSRSSARRQSTGGYTQRRASEDASDFSFTEQVRGDGSTATPAAQQAPRTPTGTGYQTRARAALTGDSSADMDLEMTPSQSLQMEYTAMSLSPASDAPQHPEQPRYPRRG